MSKKTPEIRLSQLEDILRQHPHNVSHDDIIDTAFYSYRHINRLFHQKKGESIYTFINRIRLQKAAEYLSYSSKSIFDIAIEVGYESSTSFSKMFKRAYGLSPVKFREINKKSVTPISNEPPIY